MDPIGLSGELLEQLNRDWETHLLLEESKERKARDKSLENTLALLKLLTRFLF